MYQNWCGYGSKDESMECVMCIQPAKMTMLLTSVIVQGQNVPEHQKWEENKVTD